jgi:predicted N-acetyltransferase YhbS
MCIEIRHERPADIRAIAAITEAAFRDEPYSSHTEQFIVDSLRRAGALAISLVAVDGDEVVGHVAISPVTISSGAGRWYGLGPISVRPDRQGQGIGTQLMKAALEDLRRFGGTGCVVLGQPAFYGRFGFVHHPELELPGIPAGYFQTVAFQGEVPTGLVTYHEAFSATG